VEYTSGTSSWRLAAIRARRILRRRRPEARRRWWGAGVPLIAMAAGFLFTTSASTADGTALREDRRPQLAELIEDRRARVARAERQASALRQSVAAQTDALGGQDVPIAHQRLRADGYRTQAAFTALRGPGLTVRLDDAPRRPGAHRPGEPSNDDLVVHQADVQAVVNALWAGGAEAMTIMKVRVISTTAVRCVGNTLLLDGRVYSPPFEITAIGDPDALQRALRVDEGVQRFRQAVADYGLGYRETVERDVRLPAYESTGTVRTARVPQ